jgi:hypothetical protein
VPDQLQLPDFLRARESVANLLAPECGDAISRTTVGRYLKVWSMSIQKPGRRAFERNDEVITRWSGKEYPQLAQEAMGERRAFIGATR